MRAVSYSESQERFTRERIDFVVAGLRRMADEIERDRSNKNLDLAVSNTIHTVSWGVANLSLSILTDNLARYHNAKYYELQEQLAEMQAVADET